MSDLLAPNRATAERQSQEATALNPCQSPRGATGLGRAAGGQLVPPLPAELAAAPRTNRYAIQGIIGHGATSIVYRAIDIEKYMPVALKSIRFADLQNLYMLKTEFRSLARFYHFNVVQLYDLHVDDDSCFFTMELVEGVDFVSFTRAAVPEARDGPPPGADRSVLRLALAQLFDGLAALHADGKLHRDLKPSNVLVEPGLRTVLLDFGLSTDAGDSALLESHSRFFAGTPAYMAPERLFGDPASEASDWYSVGVILYEALSGAQPYPASSPFELLEAKKGHPPPPRTGPDVPRDLADLAFALLHPDPGSRPTAAQIRRTVHADEMGGQAPAMPGFRRQQKQVFVGREAEMRQLGEAFQRSRARRPVLTLVEGMSGIGKTRLIEQFLAQAHDQDAALVLRARCSFQETLSYNAIDGLVDNLTRFLLLQGAADVARLLPADFAALALVFPVIGRIHPDQQWRTKTRAAAPHEVRREAILALGSLLDRIAEDRPLILWIDDFQWSDEGSIPFLVELLRGAGRPGLHMILSFRSEHRHGDDSIGRLSEALRSVRGTAPPEVLQVGPLAAAEIDRLVRSVVGKHVAVDAEAWQEVLRGTLGLPFFALEVAGFLDAAGSGGELLNSPIQSVADIIRYRVASLPERTRAALEVASVAGSRLTELQVLALARAQGCTAADVHQLYLQQLLRKDVIGGQTAIECYHDRVREAVLQTLPATERSVRHRQIADILTLEPSPDHELLTEHRLGAGQPAEAAAHAVLAGRKAASRLAFERAIQLFRLALDNQDRAAPAWPVEAELAAALADAGRLEEAADHFLAVSRAVGAHAPGQLQEAPYKLKAGEHLLHCGLLARGRAVIREVFGDLGLDFPETVGAARRMALGNRFWFTIQLARLRLKDRDAVRPEVLLRLDTLWGARGLLMLDFVVGDAMISRYAREAGRAGERSHTVRALGLEAAVFANIGTAWSQRRAVSLMRRASAVMDRSQDPYDRVVLEVCRAGMAWFAGRWRAAADTARSAIELHRRERGRYDFELAIARSYRLSAMVLLGDIEGTRAETMAALEDARQRGDQYVLRLFCSGYWTYVGLSHDDPDAVIAYSSGLLSEALADRFTSLHWAYFNATANALIYAGEPWQAWSLVVRFWPLIERTGFLHLACIGSHLRDIRARAALAAASGNRDAPAELARWTRQRLIRIARTDARRIGRTGTLSHAAATAAAISCGIATLRGDMQSARQLAEAAVVGYRSADMALHSAAASLQLSRLAPGREGDELRRSAMAWMHQQSVRNPERMAALIVPLWGETEQVEPATSALKS
jgi:eukaryotic-like serine/threonine-protein kinase